MLSEITTSTIQCLIDKNTGRIWVNGADGSALGRFNTKFGIDIHSSVNDQLNGKSECIDCQKGEPGWSGWIHFLKQARTLWSINIPLDALGNTTPGLSRHQAIIDTWKQEDPDRVQGFFITPDGALGCLVRFLFTWAIVADIGENSYRRRWCFHDYSEAKGAMEDWVFSGNNEPLGYIRKTHVD